MNKLESFSKPLITFKNLVYSNNGSPRILIDPSSICIDDKGELLLALEGVIDDFSGITEIEIGSSDIIRNLDKVVNSKYCKGIKDLYYHTDLELKNVLQEFDIINYINCGIIVHIRNFLTLFLVGKKLLEPDDIVDFCNSVLCNVFCIDLVMNKVSKESTMERKVLKRILIICLNDYFLDVEDYSKFI